MDSPYRPMPPQVDLPALEHEVLARWRSATSSRAAWRKPPDRPVWTFYEGPPTANGRPGTHHVEARVFKDLFPRYKTMRGHHVPRRAGWDCHGLPVELEIEKRLGFSGKKDIEAYGIAEFNAKCRESVARARRGVRPARPSGWATGSTSTRRTGPWIRSYIESVWWSLKHDLRQGPAGRRTTGSRRTARAAAPACPTTRWRRATYDVTDPSVYVRFPVTSGPLAERGASLLVWTTTPWTLISNTAVAVNPAVTYVVARPAGSEELLVVAEPLLDQVLGEGAADPGPDRRYATSSTSPTRGRSTSSTSRAPTSSGSLTT